MSEFDLRQAQAGIYVQVGATWTTDAPFRETPEAIDAPSQAGITAPTSVDLWRRKVAAFSASSRLVDLNAEAKTARTKQSSANIMHLR